MLSLTSPICDGTRLILGILATLGGIVFASMTGVLKNDIKNLYFRLFPNAKNKTEVAGPAPSSHGPSRFFSWFLLIAGFCATVFLGSYVAAVPSKTCVKIIISELVCDPGGDNLNGEYVDLQNLSGKRIHLSGWSLCDYRSLHCYEFDDYTMEPHSSVKLWTKTGTNTMTDLYFGEPRPIWDNGKDTAYLYDIKDQLIYQLPCSETVVPTVAPTAKTPEYDHLISVIVIYDGKKGEQEPDEYVEIENEGDHAIQLKDWTLSDNSGHTFLFPEYLLAPEEICRIYTNEYHPESCGFNYESSQAIWGNKGDCATLRDADGIIREQYCYN